MEKLPKVVIEAKEAGKEILELSGEEKIYYFEKPGKKDMERFLASAAKGKLAMAAQNLVMEKALVPSAEELKAEFEAMPGRMVALNNALQTAIGLNEEFGVKKL
jgi:hypothetical protein